MEDKVKFEAINFFSDKKFPEADVAILGSILHNWQWKEKEIIVKKAFEAVKPGGILMIYEKILDNEKENLGNMASSLLMNLRFKSSEMTIKEAEDLLKRHGFESSKVLEPFGKESTKVVLGYKPKN